MPGKALLGVRKELAGSGRKVLVAIDPGGKSTGFAIFQGKMLVSSGEIAADDLFLRLSVALGEELMEEGFRIGMVVEKPMYFGGRGAIAAASGRIGALYRTEGVIVGRAMGLGWKVWELTPVEWKGQLPKSVTRRKVNGLLGRMDTKVNDDEADAIALGMRVLGIW